MIRALLPVLAIATLAPDAAFAYIGPGVGAGGIAAVLGVLAAIFFAVVAIIWYPFKRLLRRLRGGAGNARSKAGENPRD